MSKALAAMNEILDSERQCALNGVEEDHVLKQAYDKEVADLCGFISGVMSAFDGVHGLEYHFTTFHTNGPHIGRIWTLTHGRHEIVAVKIDIDLFNASEPDCICVGTPPRNYDASYRKVSVDAFEEEVGRAVAKRLAKIEAVEYAKTLEVKQ